MAMKYDRRTFLKTAAAAALAVSASGVLTGCNGGGGGGGGSVPAANSIKLGEFIVALSDFKYSENGSLSEGVDSYTLKPEFKIQFTGTGSNQNQYKDIFSATINNLPLKLTNGNEKLSAADNILSRTQTCIPEFTTSHDVYYGFKHDSEPIKLKVTLQGNTALFTINSDNTIVITRV